MPDYAAWLNDERSRRNILVELDAYRPGYGLITHYFSTAGFTSRPGDTPPNTPYPALVASVPAISVGMDDALNWGDIELRNPGGVLDELLNDAFGFRGVRLYLGDPSWPKSDYIEVQLKSTKEGVSSTGTNRLRIPISDTLAALDVPIQTNTNSSGELIPLTFGSPFNCEPVFLSEDVDGAHYQVNDGAVTAIALRSGGLPVDPVRITLDLINGKFIVDPPPTSNLTCDPVQSSATVIQIASALLDRAGVAYDATNFAAWQAALPLSVGIYITDKTTYRETLNYVLNGVGLRFHAWPDGIVRLYRIAQPSGDPAAYINASGIKQRGLSPSGVIQPLAVARVGYSRNYAVQDKDSVYGAVDTEQAENYSREWRTATVEAPGRLDIYPAAAVLPDDILETALTEATDAGDEALRRLDLYAAPIQVFTVECFADPFFAPGDVVWIQYSRFGFDSGRLAMVAGFSWKPDMKRMTLTVWAWQ